MSRCCCRVRGHGVLVSLAQRFRRHNRVAPFMKRNPDANAEPMDIEDLTALGNSASGPCPYFLSREMAATADIIFMPAGFLLLLSMHGEVVTGGLQSY